LHRPVNTDSPERLKKILDALNALKQTIVFPVHPRTQQRLQAFRLDLKEYPWIQPLPPQSFLAMIHLQRNAQYILTDSGGVQKEAYLNQIPCITLRRETEWPETLEHGWNQLLFEPLEALPLLLQQAKPTKQTPYFGDGFVAERIVKILYSFCTNKGQVQKKRLFVLIPVYNEAENLPRLFHDFQKIQQKLSRYELHLFLCDDGSSDLTPVVIQEAKYPFSIKLLRVEQNQGPGAAFARGFSALAGHLQKEDLVVTMEGDNTSSLEVLLSMIRRIEQEHWDCILASPYAYGGSVTQTNGFRILLSMIANLLVRFFLKIPGIFTMSSFFRVYQGSLILRLQKHYGDAILHEKGFICMVELLKKMTDLQATLSEYPLILDTSQRKGASKMKVLQTSLEYLRYLLLSSLLFLFMAVPVKV
jgi:hypothetical protein